MAVKRIVGGCTRGLHLVRGVGGGRGLRPQPPGGGDFNPKASSQRSWGRLRLYLEAIGAESEPIGGSKAEVGGMPRRACFHYFFYLQLW